MAYHVPVMLKECLEGLRIKPNGIYVDATFGGGGHSRSILEHLTTGKLYGIDQDQDAEANILGLDDTKFEFIHGNFRYFSRYLRMQGVRKIDGVIADLGISSHQIDKPERGFSTRFEADLDMRMDEDGALSAYEVVNTYAMKELQRVLSEYGEIRNARTLAEEIIRSRISKPIESTTELVGIIKRFATKKRENKYFAQVFQAIRIEVNDEIGALREFLLASSDMLNEGGRIVVMSYHSLEDRLVKNFFNSGNFRGQEEKDIYGHSRKPFKQVTRKPIMAGQAEISRNPRARSARLRIAEKQG